MLSKLKVAISHSYDRLLEAQQFRLSSNFEGLALLSFLGLLCGIVAGLVIVAFRLSIDGGGSAILPDGPQSHSLAENFEALSPWARFGLCLAGATLIGLLLRSLNTKSRTTGITHVLERLEYHQGRLPLKNAVLQFVAASIALISGQSMGREGPSVHLGAAAGSNLARSLRIPNNGVRILVGSGVAAAISAAFNTPLAGVIFAMEVVILEYTVIGFAPVILAAVSAATIGRLVFGDTSAIMVPAFEIDVLQQLPLVVLMGALIGAISAAFIQLTVYASTLTRSIPILFRCVIAGLITGLLAMFAPEIMGTGYDTVNGLMLAQIGLAGLAVLLIAKIVATASSVGLGMPAGVIGPLLFIGATVGSAVGLISNQLFGGNEPTSYFTIIGMASMMAATLHAPLAALIYLLELTANQAILLPGMATVITALIVSQVVFGKSSIYRHLMLSQGLDYRNNAASQALRKIGVASVMEQNIIKHPRFSSLDQAGQLLDSEPRWILLTNQKDSSRNSLLPAIDLARFLNEIGHTDAELSESIHLEEKEASASDGEIDLLNIPAKFEDTCAITILATLQEAHQQMQDHECSVAYVTGAHGATKERIYGVVTREHIDKQYKI